MDFTLGKRFKLGEQQSLRFRADFFNLFNHLSFAIPSGCSKCCRGVRADHLGGGNTALDSIFAEVLVLMEAGR